MKVKFLGAVGNVTGSCTWFDYSRQEIQFLVDCGMVQGEAIADRVNRGTLPFKAKDIDFVLLTHAHIDHCGLLPRLVNEGFVGKVYCTSATAALARLALTDAAGQRDAPIRQADVDALRFEALDQRRDFGLSRMIPIHQDLFVAATRTAHILGAVSFTIGWLDADDRKLSMVLSGDLGNNTKANPYQPLLASRQVPFAHPNYMLVESTYGDRERNSQFKSHDGRLSAIALLVQEALVDRQGPLIIPAFAIHRTQELLVDLLEALAAMTASRGGLQMLSDRCVESVASLGLNSATLDRWVRNSGDETKLLADEIRQRMESRPVEQLDGTEPVERLFPISNEANSLIDLREKLQRLTRPVQVILDGKLASRVCRVYAAELGRRQMTAPAETLFRHRGLAARFGVSSEDSLDSRLAALFCPDDGGRSASTSAVRLCFDGVDKTWAPLSQKSCATILLTGGGMCDGGPVLAHLKKHLPNAEATVALSGYAARGSTAGELKGLAHTIAIAKRRPFLTIDSEVIQAADVKATVRDLAAYYSGHADRPGLVNFVLEMRADPRAEADRPPPPMTLFINHGTDQMRAGLVEALTQRMGAQLPDDRVLADIHMPFRNGPWFDLDTGRWMEPDETLASVAAKVSRGDEAILLELRELRSRVDELFVLVQQSVGAGELRDAKED